MAETLLGPFAPHWRGDYNPNTVYQFLDIVYLDGSTWLRIEQAESSGVQPGTDADVWARSSTSASTVDRDRAEAAANLAGQHKDDAQTAAGAAQTAQDAAETAQGAAETSAGNAANSATLAGQHKDAAAASESSAAASATAAQTAAASVPTIDQTYPVGIIIELAIDTDPATLWPGTIWAPLGVGRVTVGIDANDTDFDTIGKTGGEKAHALTVAEGPTHDHASGTSGYFVWGGAAETAKPTASVSSSFWTELNRIRTGTSGSGQAHNNMPPYEVVYRYKRTGTV